MFKQIYILFFSRLVNINVGILMSESVLTSDVDLTSEDKCKTFISGLSTF